MPVTAQNIIYKSLRLLGVLASGEAPTAAEAQDALYSLNSLIDSFQANPQFYFYTQNETFSLEAARGIFTIGNDVVPVVSITRDTTVATVTTETPHNLQSGGKITISGATPAGYNLTAVITVTSATTFTYTVSNALATPATGTITYTSGDFVTGRPLRIVGAYTAANSVDTPMGLITEQYWNNISDKSATSVTPQKLLYRPSYPFGYILVYPMPTNSTTVFIRSEKMIQTYSGLTISQYLPPGYQRLLELSLAVDLSSEYGTRVSPEVIAYLKSDLSAVMRTNLSKLPSSKIGAVPNSNVYTDTTLAGSQAIPLGVNG
jgi:hypothetical protein